MELDALLLGMRDLFNTRRHLLFGAAINQVHLFRSKTHGCTGRIHRHIAPAQNSHLLRWVDRRMRTTLIVGLHEVGARQIFVRRKDTDQIFARDVHKFRQACPGSDEHRGKAVLLHQILDLARASNHKIRFQLHTHLRERVDLLLHNRLGQAELGDAINKHAARLMERFEHHNLMAFAPHIRRHRDTRRSAANHRHALACRRLDSRDLLRTLFTLQVSNIALDASNGDRQLHILQRLAEGTRLLTLRLLRTDTSADRRQQTAFTDDRDRLIKASFGCGFQEIRDANAHGATLDARRCLTLQATHGFHTRLLSRVPERDFSHVLSPHVRILRRHLLSRNGHAILRGEIFVLQLRKLYGSLAVKCFRCLMHKINCVIALVPYCVISTSELRIIS